MLCPNKLSYRHAETAEPVNMNYPLSERQGSGIGKDGRAMAPIPSTENYIKEKAQN